MNHNHELNCVLKTYYESKQIKINSLFKNREKCQMFPFNFAYNFYDYVLKFIEI